MHFNGLFERQKVFHFLLKLVCYLFCCKKSIIIFQTKRNKRIAYTVWLYLVIYIMLIVPKKDSFNEEKCHRMFSFERWDFSFVLRNNFLETLSLLRKIKYMQFVLFDRSRDLRYKKCHMGIHVQYKECLHRSLYMDLFLVYLSLMLFRLFSFSLNFSHFIFIKMNKIM